jgi:hypothetical protein
MSMGRKGEDRKERGEGGVMLKNVAGGLGAWSMHKY